MPSGFGGRDVAGTRAGRVGWRRGCPRWRGSRRRLRLTGPDEDPALLIHCQALAVDELVFEDLQMGLIQLELELEGPIGQATPLAQEGDRLIHHRDKVHRVSSLPGCCQ